MAFITGGVCQGALVEWLGSVATSTNIYVAAGYIMFFSFWVMFYQISAIVQLFVRFQILYTTKIPCGRLTLFSLLVS